MIKNTLTSSLYFILILIIAVYSVYKAEYNWDTLTYAACVFSYETDNINEIHDKTYDEVKKIFPENAYELAVSSNDYRKEMFSCPQCFYEQLPFYKIRPLYIFLIYLFYKSGFNIVTAPVIISSISCFIISAFLFFRLRGLFKNIFPGAFISLLVSLSPFLLNAASEASPNALSAMIVFIALFMLFKKKTIIFLVLMLLSILARPDNLLLLVLFTAALIISNENKRKEKRFLFPGAIIAGLILFYINNKLSGNYSWAILFEHSFNDRIIHPASYTSALTPGMYLSSFAKWAVLFKFSFISFQAVLLILLFYLKKPGLKNLRSDFESCLIIAAALSIILHYLIYPVMDDKYFIAQYLFIDIVFIKNVIEKFKPAGSVPG